MPLQGPPNGMPGMQQPPNLVAQQALSNPAHFLKQHGIQVSPNASQQEVMAIARSMLQNYQHQQSKQLTTYNRTLAAQQSQQGLNNRPPVPSQNPPNPQNLIQFTNSLSSLSFPTTGAAASQIPTPAQLAQLDQVAKQLGGTLTHPSSGSHSLADYQNQLMVLEQQNKKRLHHARQETNGRDDPANGQQFPPPQGGGLQPGGTPLAGTSMSPSNSRTGPSPQISNSELQGQRKPGQKTGSGAASPEPEGQIRGPSPAFVAQQGVMTPDLAQMAQMSGQGYQHPLAGPNGQPVQFSGRPHQGMPFNQGQPQMPVEMMKRMQQGQFSQNWQQPMSQQAFNAMNPVNCLSFPYADSLGIETTRNGPWTTSRSTDSTRQRRRTNASTSTTSTTRWTRNPSLRPQRVSLPPKRESSNAQPSQQIRLQSQSNKRETEAKQRKSKRYPSYPQRSRNPRYTHDSHDAPSTTSLQPATRPQSRRRPGPTTAR